MNDNEIQNTDGEEFDLAKELIIVFVIMVAGLIALPFSTTIAMILCFGGLLIYAGWLAIVPQFRTR